MDWARSEKKVQRDYNTVCWSDEVTFFIREDGNTTYVTRGPGEEWEDKNLKPTFKSRRIGVGVWSCFCGNEMGPLVIIPKGGRMTAERYKEVLKDHFIPFYKRMRRKYGPSVVLQQDNAPWHKAKTVQALLKASRVKVLFWPPQSPDLSLIENLWKQIKDMLGKRRYRVKRIEDMESALAEV